MICPVYLVSPPGTRRDRQVASLGGDVRVLDRLDALASLDQQAPGWVLVDRAAAEPAEVLRLAARAWTAGSPWLVAEMAGEGEGGEDCARSISLGPVTPLEAAGARLRGEPGAQGALLELRAVLSEISKVRHDLNNPLTSALAEVQILLLDAPDEETREALGVIQAQLRRMRDLLASTSHLRPPRD